MRLNILLRAKCQFYITLAITLVIFLFLVNYTKLQIYYIYNTAAQVSNNSGLKLPLTSILDSNRHYNLMEERNIIDRVFDNYSSDQCTIEFMNANKLWQDHPCVIETIRNSYMKKPSPLNIPIQLDKNDMDDRSDGQTKVILEILKNQRNGFFLECGAYDGEFLSNTLDLERKFNWSGLLIEAHPMVFKKLLSRNRKAWTFPVCLSLEPFPTKVNFQPKSFPAISHIEGAAKTNQEPGLLGIDPEMISIQCFPLYSVLLAAGRTDVDFFSLDVEGHELKVLQTIPWHKVNIKTLTVEWDHIPDGKDALLEFMEKRGYITFGALEFAYTKDIVFIKDYLNAA